MREFCKRYLADEGGAAAAEYALILALVGAGIAVAAVLLRNSIVTAMTNVADIIANAN
jgi:pilus assembly protein Flp/PilA